jgi:ribosomal protein L29
MANKKEKFTDIKVVDLKKKIVQLREELRIIRFKAEGAKPKNVKESAMLKKKIARVLTALNKNNNSR